MVAKTVMNYKSFPLKMTFIKDSFKDFNYMKIFKDKYGYIDSSLKNKYFFKEKQTKIKQRKANIK